MKTQFIPELLAPAGTMEKLEVALLYGADAVYLGGKALNLRSGSGGFTWKELDIATDKAHKVGAKVYYCLNSFIHDEHIAELEYTVERLSHTAVDALIIADPGTLSLTRKRFPKAEIHLSTQANTINRLSIDFWKDMGVHRVNLARELTIKEIRDIKNKTSDIELEVFVHGAMCMAISGQCFMSKWINDREANLGECTQPCRFSYSEETAREVSITEEKRKELGPTWFIEQKENYSALLASEDLCLAPYIPWFIKNGIHSLKIEGRMKSIGYLAYAVNAYKMALQDAIKGTFSKEQYISMLYNQASRPLSSGFFLPQGRAILPKPQNQKITTVVARIESKISDNSYAVSVRQPWDTSIPIEFLFPQQPSIATTKYSLESSTGNRLECAHPGMTHIFHYEGGSIPIGILLQQ